MMSLTVRCLASTRVTEARQETGRDGEDDGELCDKETEELQGEKTESDDSGKDVDDVEDVQAEDEDNSDDGHASTSGSSNTSTESDSDVSTSRDSVPFTSCIQEAQLSPDGTCIFTSDYDRKFSVYPISNDILASTTARPLAPYAQFKSPDPIWAFAANPLFNLQDASSTHVLVSRRDRYITLHNALWDISDSPTSQEPQPTPLTPINIHTPITSYKLINHLTEAITAPLSLAYSPTGTHFFAGGQSTISTFDLTHTDNPIHTIPTIPSKRSKLKGGGRGFKGTIAALSVSPCASLLAAGARTRHIGIYDPLSGAAVTQFALPRTADLSHMRTGDQALMGAGVSSLKWSPCGSYLYVAERMSDVLLIYDVRNFALALGCCVGRRALTKQKLGFDVWGAGAGVYDSGTHEVWAGGTDGRVRVWKDPYLKEGAIEADEVVGADDGEGTPVVSTLVHASGSLAVTAHGSLDVDGGDGRGGIARGGRTRPKFTERGYLDILGLSSY